jgi:hypothetical protein
LWELGSTIDHHYRCGSVGGSYGAGHQPFSLAAGFVGREGYTGLIAFPSYVEPDEIAGDDAVVNVSVSLWSLSHAASSASEGPGKLLPWAHHLTRRLTFRGCEIETVS